MNFILRLPYLELIYLLYEFYNTIRKIPNRSSYLIYSRTGALITMEAATAVVAHTLAHTHTHGQSAHTNV